ncbi:MAG: glycosyltransferase family 87 protein [Candidatus Natronoplasma sp.]
MSVHYNTTWDEEGVIILKRIPEMSGNETWKREKTFEDSGEVYFYYRMDKRDIARYHRRASVLLERGNLYEDTRTGPPPLINFAFIPPTLLSPPASYGGYYLSFYLYFALFTLLGGILLFHTFKRWGEDKAYLVSLLYIFNPISLTAIIQDESVIAFIIIVTIFILVRGREKIGAFTIGLGSVTKIWSSFFIPSQLFDRNIELRKRIQNIILTGLIVGALFLFFYYIWGPKVFGFLRFYGGVPSQFNFRDVSIWKSISRLPVGVPLPGTTPILIALGISESILLYAAYRKRCDTIAIFTLTLFLFMLFYPKMHLDYYLLLLPALLFYSVRSGRYFKLFLVFFSFLMLSRSFTYSPYDPYHITA